MPPDRTEATILPAEAAEAAEAAAPSLATPVRCL
jgi:hypothetical protein